MSSKPRAAAPQALRLNERHWPALDGLRAVAILEVMAAHLFLSHFQSGQAGVDIFFVLSGFLITWLLITEFDNWSKVNLGAFYARRALRLLPAFFAVVLVVTAGVTLVGRLLPFRTPTLTDLPWVIFYIGNYNIGDISYSNLLGHTWSLSLEEQFYVLWPVLSLGVLIRRWRRQSVAIVLWVLAGLEMVARLLYLRHGGNLNFSYRAIFLHSDGLMLGAGVAFALKSPLAEWTKTHIAKTVTGLGAALGVIALVLVFLGEPSVLTVQQAFIPVASLSTSAILVNVLTQPLLPLEWVLSCRPAVWIGKRSYGLYLWHWPIFRAISIVSYHGRVEHAALILVDFTASFVVAALSYRFIERPWLRRKDRFERVPTTVEPSV
jgi:peptidoglycan/LPS O-acetylase OafA/YrhL